jgi:general L-amino acid transport system permease protein
VVAWVVAAAAMFLLTRGGILGLRPVETCNWGGITVTVFIAVFGLAAGYPLAILLALGRRARLPVVRALATAMIEGVRGVPLIALVFMAAVMVPLFLPSGIDIDQLFRIQAAYTIFSAAYLAEVVRGGLQALDGGQVEAARALGLRYWPMMRLVVLPQALRITVPAQVGTFITLFKDTTLVIIAGVFDFFTTLKAALGDSDWLGFTVEAYVYAALVYFVLCFAMSRYSRRLEAPHEAAPR